MNQTMKVCSFEWKEIHRANSFGREQYRRKEGPSQAREVYQEVRGVYQKARRVYQSNNKFRRLSTIICFINLMSIQNEFCKKVNIYVCCLKGTSILIHHGSRIFECCHSHDTLLFDVILLKLGENLFVDKVVFKSYVSIENCVL